MQLLVLFESHMHAEYSWARVNGAMHLLDGIVRYLALTQLDSADPDVTRFTIDATIRLRANAIRMNSAGLGAIGCQCEHLKLRRTSGCPRRGPA